LSGFRFVFAIDREPFSGSRNGSRYDDQSEFYQCFCRLQFYCATLDL